MRHPSPVKYSPDSDIVYIPEDGEFIPIELEGFENQLFQRKVSRPPLKIVTESHFLEADDELWDNPSDQDNTRKDVRPFTSGHRDEAEFGTEAQIISKLTMEARHIGGLFILLFGSLLGLGLASQAQVIAPLIAWVGIIFGMSFIAMDYIARRPMLPSKL